MVSSGLAEATVVPRHPLRTLPEGQVVLWRVPGMPTVLLVVASGRVILTLNEGLIKPRVIPLGVTTSKIQSMVKRLSKTR